MSRIEPAPEVGEDFEHILDPLTSHEVAHAADRLMEIIKATDMLVTNPLIDRQAINDKRELVTGHGSHGPPALCRYVDRIDTMFVLAIRAQREAGFARWQRRPRPFSHLASGNTYNSTAK